MSAPSHLPNDGCLVFASPLSFILSGNGDDENTLECVEEGTSAIALEKHNYYLC